MEVRIWVATCLCCLGLFLADTTAEKLIKIALKRTSPATEALMEADIDVNRLHLLDHRKPKPHPIKNDSVALLKYLDSEFYGIIRIGHPGQPFRVVFDTAWANTWVPSSQCSYFNIVCQMKNKYNSAKSSTYVENGHAFNATPINLSGVLSTDNINLGHITVKNQTFAEVTQIPYSYFFSKVDGTLGLAYKALAIDGVAPIFYNMIKQNLIEKPVFSFYINRDRTTNRAGNFIIGGSDKKHYQGNFTYVGVTEKLYWRFHMDKVRLDIKKKPLEFCTGGCDAIIDTSTTIIYGPMKDVNAINKLIGAQTIWKINRLRVECNKINVLPELSFIIAGKNFTLKGRDYVQQMTMGGIQVCLSTFVATTLPGEYGNMWTLGAAFIAQFYTEFDLQNNRIGFALVKE